MSREAWAEIIEQIKAAHNILVLSHQSPDPDAFGSSCGLTLALHHLGKKVVCVNQDGAVPNLSFIPYADQVLDHIPSEKFDLAIVCDCGDKKRIGEVILGELPDDLPIINIDHHYSNNNLMSCHRTDINGPYCWYKCCSFLPHRKQPCHF